MQHELSAAGCGYPWHNGKYDTWTQQAVGDFQNDNRLWNEPWGTFTPATRAALDAGGTCVGF
ncbi:hypothetical protein GCM10009665_34910 [Kitasatospora nipponensis]|uniref:Peptidoglycan binding protein n=2 Tax=Kitasatospora nipponensis TaxID=258049 RepID=A0ABN1WBB4_9ACTN